MAALGLSAPSPLSGPWAYQEPDGSWGVYTYAPRPGHSEPRWRRIQCLDERAALSLAGLLSREEG